MSLRVRGAIESSSSGDASALAEFDAIVHRAQQGDVDAFEIIYRAQAPAVFSLCRRMVGNEGDARDLTQDTFVRAWERLIQFRGQSDIGTWLHRIAVNVVLLHLRGSKRDALRLLDADDEVPSVRATDASIHIRLDVDAALAQLPSGARTVFVLHDVEGYSHDEISQMLGLAPGTVRTQLWRARRALMRLLDS
ncbi:MAG TPA: RNA polymerase sigma factor [Gemmatimonadaceae bacterium]